LTQNEILRRRSSGGGGEGGFFGREEKVLKGRKKPHRRRQDRSIFDPHVGAWGERNLRNGEEGRDEMSKGKEKSL